MAIVRKLLLLLALLVLLLLGAVFAVSNPGSIPVDVGLMRIESVPIPVAFTCAFALGWVFGLVCAAPALARRAAERRRLRRDLAAAEARFAPSATGPAPDAD